MIHRMMNHHQMILDQNLRMDQENQSLHENLLKFSSLSAVKSVKRKGGGIDFEALSRHGYKGGLSVLKVPPPKEEPNRDWTWSTGKERAGDRDIEESYKERQKTRASLADGEELATAITQKDKKSFAQKEKRKRDLGQTSRGKNYVEEEKRLLRESGVYSGFDI
ncbi:uncharacterized protein LOC104889535 isoform X2 [Beta vulgaris subsp. vulgaris]|uniref:uncharacterized protein LOC104889535 isoform X2 n=1 Tax=Beta vulgaris subsp. vulgaris TaxID=3555 RepID=UPI0020368E06|nr:uncharacterized protein LOC104889535 isoform X2 [Beta vulgaris subsp. vulgaris]